MSLHKITMKNLLKWSLMIKQMVFLLRWDVGNNVTKNQRHVLGRIMSTLKRGMLEEGLLVFSGIKILAHGHRLANCSDSPKHYQCLANP